jgi:hypothetical protein
MIAQTTRETVSKASASARTALPATSHLPLAVSASAGRLAEATAFLIASSIIRIRG